MRATGLRLFECLQLLAPALVGIAACGSPQGALRRYAIYLVALFLHLLFTYTYNDFAERHQDRDNPRKSAQPRVSRRRLAAVSASTFVGCLTLLPWLPARLAWPLAGFQIAGILYSHPRTRWKARAPLGDLLHVATGAGYYVTGCWVDGLRGGSVVLWGALAFGTIYVSGSLLGQLRDLAADRRAGLSTSAGRLGARSALALAVALQVGGLAALIPLAPTPLAVAVLATAVPLHVAGTALSLRRSAPERLRTFQRRYRVVFGFAVAVLLVSLAPPWLAGGGATDDAGRAAQATADTGHATVAEIDRAVAGGLDHLSGARDDHGRWPYRRSRSADLDDSEEVPAQVFPALHVLVTLSVVPEVTDAWVEPTRAWLLDQMEPDWVWSTDGREHPLAFRVGDEPCWLEPDIESTTLGLALFGRRLGLDAAALEAARRRFEPYRLPSGLYRTWFDDYYGERGCPAYDHQDRASVGSNLHVLGWLEGNGLDATELVAGLGRAVAVERFWEDAVYYRSLPMLAHLASNAVSMGSRSAEPLLARLLELDADPRTARDPSALRTADLAAWIQATEHLCRLRRSRCDEAAAAAVDELLARRQADGGWPASGIFVSEITEQSFAREIYPRVRDALLARTGRAPTLEQALAHADLGRHYYGSRAESTALAVRALHEHRSTRSGPR